MMAALWLLVTRTKLGKAMRATAIDREAAAMMGIDVDRVIVKTFFIGSALAGAAGVLVGLVFGQINHSMGFNYGLKGFTAAVVGGIGSIPGAMFGGLFIGLVEALSVGYIEDFTFGRLGSSFSDLIVFSILVLFMILRPQGIFGKPDVKKV
jgi:branched-chain amino acid transport system permease protein